jgi:hypothetical protein
MARMVTSAHRILMFGELIQYDIVLLVGQRTSAGLERCMGLELPQNLGKLCLRVLSSLARDVSYECRSNTCTSAPVLEEEADRPSKA